MARALRIEYEGAVYHVTVRGNERRNIFFSKRDYEKFKEYLGEAKEKYRFLLGWNKGTGTKLREDSAGKRGRMYFPWGKTEEYGVEP
jgi:hypothetical protein